MKKIAISVLALVSELCLAWDGYDYQKGQFIEIEKGNLVRSGREIEVFDYSEGYKTYEVESINSRAFGGAEIEVRDPGTGETRTFDMDQ